MIKLIIVIGVCSLIGAILCGIRTKMLNYNNMWESIIGGIFQGAIIAIIIVSIIFSSTENSNKATTTCVDTKPLVSMKFDKNINGEFFLGTGRVDNTDYTVFYTRNGKEIVRNKFKAENIKIISGTHNPTAKITKRDNSITLSTWFGKLPTSHEYTYEIELHIPEESIVENINLN